MGATCPDTNEPLVLNGRRIDVTVDTSAKAVLDGPCVSLEEERESGVGGGRPPDVAAKGKRVGRGTRRDLEAVGVAATGSAMAGGVSE